MFPRLQNRRYLGRRQGRQGGGQKDTQVSGLHAHRGWRKWSPRFTVLCDVTRDSGLFCGPQCAVSVSTLMGICQIFFKGDTSGGILAVIAPRRRTERRTGVSRQIALPRSANVSDRTRAHPNRHQRQPTHCRGPSQAGRPGRRVLVQGPRRQRVPLAAGLAVVGERTQGTSVVVWERGILRAGLGSCLCARSA